MSRGPTLHAWNEANMRTILVRLSVAFKRKYYKGPSGINEHIKEFGRSIGKVIGYTQWPNTKTSGPEVEVLWGEGLKYLYFPEQLEVVRRPITPEMRASPPTKLPELSPENLRRAKEAEKRYLEFAKPKKRK